MSDKKTSVSSRISHWEKSIERSRLPSRAVLENTAATRIQATWKGYKTRKRYAKLSKLNRYRTQVVNELWSTEEAYVTQLEQMVEAFVIPLRQAVAQKQPIITEAEIRTIFSTIEIIVATNRSLLTELTRVVKDKWHPNQLVCKTLVHMASFMKVYTDYVQNFNDALKQIQECKKNNPEFLKFHDNAFKNMRTTNVDLPSFLITPVQRIPRYKLLLTDLAKHTWEEHPDYKNLILALEKITETATYVNQKQNEALNVQKVLSIQSTLTGKRLESLVDPQRRFVREGSLIELNDKGKSGKQRWFILFNDIIVRCKMSASMLRKSMKKGLAPTFEYMGKFTLEDAELVNLGDEGHNKYSFEIVATRYTSLWLAAASEKEKEEWMTDIRECIASLKKKKNFYDEQATKIAAQKAAQAKALIGEKYAGYRVHGSYTTGSPGSRRASTTDIAPDSPGSYKKMTFMDRLEMQRKAEEKLKNLEEEEKNMQEKAKVRAEEFMDCIDKRHSLSASIEAMDITPPKKSKRWTSVLTKDADGVLTTSPSTSKKKKKKDRCSLEVTNPKHKQNDSTSSSSLGEGGGGRSRSASDMDQVEAAAVANSLSVPSSSSSPSGSGLRKFALKRASMRASREYDPSSSLLEGEETNEEDEEREKRKHKNKSSGDEGEEGEEGGKSRHKKEKKKKGGSSGSLIIERNNGKKKNRRRSAEGNQNGTDSNDDEDKEEQILSSDDENDDGLNQHQETNTEDCLSSSEGSSVISTNEEQPRLRKFTALKRDVYQSRSATLGTSTGNLSSSSSPSSSPSSEHRHHNGGSGVSGSGGGKPFSPAMKSKRFPSLTRGDSKTKKKEKEKEKEQKEKEQKEKEPKDKEKKQQRRDSSSRIVSGRHGASLIAERSRFAFVLLSLLSLSLSLSRSLFILI
ncbi:putative mitochondrial DNA polymerase I protein C [Balamuthia mandrillaris]